MSGNFAIKGGGRTPNGKCHLKFPFWFFESVPYSDFNSCIFCIEPSCLAINCPCYCQCNVLTHLLSVLRAGNNEYQWKNIVFKAHEGVQERCRYLFCCFEGNRNGRSPPFTQSQHLSNRENVLYKLHLCRPYMSKCEQSGGFSVELCHICFLLPLILCWIMDSKEGLGRSKQND